MKPLSTGSTQLRSSSPSTGSLSVVKIKEPESGGDLGIKKWSSAEAVSMATFSLCSRFNIFGALCCVHHRC